MRTIQHRVAGSKFDIPSHTLKPTSEPVKEADTTPGQEVANIMDRLLITEHNCSP